MTTDKPENFEPPQEQLPIGDAVVHGLIHALTGCVNDGLETQVFFPLNTAGLFMSSAIVCGYCHQALRVKSIQNTLYVSKPDDLPSLAENDVVDK